MRLVLLMVMGVDALTVMQNAGRAFGDGYACSCIIPSAHAPLTVSPGRRDELHSTTSTLLDRSLQAVVIKHLMQSQFILMKST